MLGLETHKTPFIILKKLFNALLDIVIKQDVKNATTAKSVKKKQHKAQTVEDSNSFSVCQCR